MQYSCGATTVLVRYCSNSTLPGSVPRRTSRRESLDDARSGLRSAPRRHPGADLRAVPTRASRFQGTVAALALIPCCVAYARLSPQRAQHIGDLAMLICILMYASPLSVVRQVIARRSSDLLPPAQCAMQFANCLAWMVVGMNSHATQVLICNGLGFALGVLQLSLLVAFPAAKRGHAPLTEGEQAV